MALKPTPATEFLRAPDKLAAVPVYAVFGPEDYLRRKCLNLLLEALRKRGLEPQRAPEDITAAGLLDTLRTPPMFSGPVALVVLNQRSGPRQEASTRFKDEFVAYLENPSRKNVLVFDAPTWARNLTVPKRVSENFPTIQCDELKPWDTRTWQEIAASHAGTLGLKLDAAAMTALREYTGGKLARAANELEKLALLAPAGKVTADHIAQACGYEGADLTFPLCDALLKGDSRQALAHAAKLAGKAELGSVLSLLALLRLQVVNMGRAAQALRQGLGGDAALGATSVRLRDADKAAFLKTARTVTAADLETALETLLWADEQMKSAAPDPANLLVGVVSRLCDSLHSAETGALR